MKAAAGSRINPQRSRSSLTGESRCGVPGPRYRLPMTPERRFDNDWRRGFPPSGGRTRLRGPCLGYTDLIGRRWSLAAESPPLRPGFRALSAGRESSPSTDESRETCHTFTLVSCPCVGPDEAAGGGCSHFLRCFHLHPCDDTFEVLGSAWHGPGPAAAEPRPGLAGSCAGGKERRRPLCNSNGILRNKHDEKMPG